LTDNRQHETKIVDLHQTDEELDTLAAQQTDERSSRMPAGKRLGLTGMALALLLAVLAAVGYSLWTPSPLGILEASGRIEGRQTTLSAKSGGVVKHLPVDEGTTVAQGDTLAILDDMTQRARVRSAEERVSALKAQLRAVDLDLQTYERQIQLRIEQAEAALVEAHARVQRADAVHAQAKREAERYNTLSLQNVTPEQRAEDARLQEAVAREALAEARSAERRADKDLELAQLDKKRIGIKHAEREASNRQVAEAEAALQEQRSYIKEFTVLAPIDGTVLARNIEIGERVNAGAPLFTLVDLDKLYVKVYIPEPDIGKIVLGQQAQVRIDAYPDITFPARVTRIAQQAQFTPKNVETKQERVKLVFAIELSLMENPGGVLKPGMPADGFVEVVPPESMTTPKTNP